MQIATSAAVPSPEGEPTSQEFLQAVLRATEAQGGRSLGHHLLERLLEEPALQRRAPRRLPGPDGRLDGRRWSIRFLSQILARLDSCIARQVDAILHHADFQRLEASWRGLRFLMGEVDPQEQVKVKVLNVSWKALEKDFSEAPEFDRSQLFKKVYTEEFDMPGGEPYGVLIGDYEVRHTRSEDHPTDDLDVLGSISQVAAAAFAPFIAGVDPELLGVQRFARLERTLHQVRDFEELEYLKWREFRKASDSRFVGLTLPRTLMRLPYEDDGSRDYGFRYREEVEVGPGEAFGPEGRPRTPESKYLWGNASFAFGSVLIKAFKSSRWLAEIRGVRRDEDGGGLVTGLPVHSFRTDRRGVAPKCSTDLIVTDQQEKELGDLGFIPLCHLKDMEYCAFYGNQSVHKPEVYTELAATMNARISTMLQYIFCASRIAHYLKVQIRHKIGTYTDAGRLQTYLNDWINQYVAADENASTEVKAKFPLKEAQVEVREIPGKPGSFECVLHLMPHYQLDAITAAVVLKTKLARG